MLTVVGITEVKLNYCLDTWIFSDGCWKFGLGFFELYAFIILTSTLVRGINYFVIITRPLHPIPVRKRSSSSCYMIETYNTRHRFPCY